MSQEDEDFARAIALSLREAGSQPEIIDLATTEDEVDDEARFERELQKAIVASQMEQAHAKPDIPTSISEKAQEKQPEQPLAQARTPMSAFMAERALLEKERLARQKRLRPESFSTSNQDDDDEDDEDEYDTREPPAKRQNVSSCSSFSSRSNIRGRSGAQPSQEVPTINQVFWNGELRQTATRYADPRADGKPTFRLTEVLGPKSDLEFAIVSSYSLDWGWIYPFFDPSVPVIMVAQPDSSAQGKSSVKHVLPNWVRTTPTLRGGFGCQHMKFMLLFYKTGRLRIVISTANLIDYDWRDMENSVWLQDIPLRSRPLTVTSKDNVDDFPTILQRMLYAINVKPALTAVISDNHPNLPIKSIDELRQRWDWSNVKAQLVASIAGKHEGWPSVVQTGHPRLMMAIRQLGMRTHKGVHKGLLLECQGSSLGTYTTQWLNEFHYSARGESAEDWLNKSKKSRESLPLPPVKIVFPTNATVKESAGGEAGGGTIFCRRKQWSAKNFPRSLFHDSRSKAGPALMHSKMIIATLRDNTSSTAGSSTKRRPNVPSDTEDDDSSDEIEVVDPGVGWAYVGSHNFTPSAWGTLSGSSFNPILNTSHGYRKNPPITSKDENCRAEFTVHPLFASTPA
ncbi:hypothetical protein CVT24_004588 [Panaeolus cyanescens]|uniref:PLD phosphodiesterase domain-containing protein n=1 Tax=Panaeolus cyanescens TaxID=181874 RepID=A0A409YBB8_9AGAR|nr:hypothetical protein CVT24_004588 [Panaeolus cyanescens]